MKTVKIYRNICLIFGFFFCFALQCRSQDSISIEQCYTWLEEAHPLAASNTLYKQQMELSNKQINAAFLPSLSLNGQAYYQSDVTSVVIPIPGIDIPYPSKDNYKFYLDFQQTIWDGGYTGYQKKLNTLNTELSIKESKLKIENSRTQLRSIYFNILLLDKQSDLNMLFIQKLHAKKNEVQAAVNEGIMLASVLWNLEAELLSLESSAQEIITRRSGLVEQLSVLSGRALKENIILIAPADLGIHANAPQRLESQLFHLQQQKLMLASESLQVKQMPKLQAYAQAGYGKPGLNMFSDDFDTYYILGAGFVWPLWNRGEVKKEREKLQISKQLIQGNQLEFDRGLSVLTQQYETEIRRLELLIVTDQKIIGLREKISSEAGQRLMEGTITPADYIQELNTEKQARQIENLHRIQLLKARWDLNEAWNNIH